MNPLPETPADIGARPQVIQLDNLVCSTPECRSRTALLSRLVYYAGTPDWQTCGKHFGARHE